MRVVNSQHPFRLANCTTGHRTDVHVRQCPRESAQCCVARPERPAGPGAGCCLARAAVCPATPALPASIRRRPVSCELLAAYAARPVATRRAAASASSRGASAPMTRSQCPAALEVACAGSGRPLLPPCYALERALLPISRLPEKPGESLIRGCIFPLAPALMNRQKHLHVGLLLRDLRKACGSRSRLDLQHAAAEGPHRLAR